MSVIVYFGVPGSGKTTLAAKIAFKNAKRGIKTYSNVPITGTLLIDSSDIGEVDISDGDLILDEAAIDFNNRSYKTLSKNTIKWLKLHRHYGIGTIHVFSQSYDDMDITIRRLQTVMFRLTRTIIPGVFMSRRIGVSIDIDKESHQLIERYRWSGLPRFHAGWKYWSMFDSWAAPPLPASDFQSVGLPPHASFKELRNTIRSARKRALKEKLLGLFVKVQFALVAARLRHGKSPFLNNK